VNKRITETGEGEGLGFNHGEEEFMIGVQPNCVIKSMCAWPSNFRIDRGPCVPDQAISETVTGRLDRQKRGVHQYSWIPKNFRRRWWRREGRRRRLRIWEGRTARAAVVVLGAVRGAGFLDSGVESCSSTPWTTVASAPWTINRCRVDGSPSPWKPGAKR